MNLYIETVATYIVTAWSQTLVSQSSEQELRFILESLDPEGAFDLCAALEAHQQTQRQKIETHFKVATGLWREWQRHYSRSELQQQMAQRGGIGSGGELRWIDADDRMTWYRNRTLQPGSDGLVVVLIGLNHTTDQGGLADFHRVDEQRIWAVMEQNFRGWITRLCQRLGIDANDSEIDRLDEILQRLFSVRPRQLARLAGFIESELISSDTPCDTLSELIEQFYIALPFWEIPPLWQVPKDRRGREAVVEAAAFIARHPFKSATDQKKGWAKLEAALAADQLTLPEVRGGAAIYADLPSYRETLHAFIHKADTAARGRLLQSDLWPVLEILKRKVSKAKSEKQKVRLLEGSSLEVVLRAVWETIAEFQRAHGGRALSETLSRVRIVAERFMHDLDADEEAGCDRHTQAAEVVRGVLGGLHERLLQAPLYLLNDEGVLDEEGGGVEWGLEWEAVSFGTSRASPHLQFRVLLESFEDEADEECFSRPFRWAFGPNHPERVRLRAVQEVLQRWDRFERPLRLLPAFAVPSVVITALYYAADIEEANRLLQQGFAEMELVDLLQDCPPNSLSPTLEDRLERLTRRYRQFLDHYRAHGYYAALHENYVELLQSYLHCVETLLRPEERGAAWLLPRFYKAFLLLEAPLVPAAPFISAAVAWGLTPAVLELTEAQMRLLCDSFSEVVALRQQGLEGAAQAFDRLNGLVMLRRPLAGMVVDAKGTLSAAIKPYGLIHYFGTPPATGKSLAVQTLLREEEIDDDENLTDLVQESDESRVVKRVVNDYRQLYPMAEDGVRILALHVEDLSQLLGGIDRFLADYLKQSPPSWPTFCCELMVYSTSASPLAVERQLALWRDQRMAIYRDKGRSLILRVGHRYARQQQQMIKALKEEKRLYDIAFLFNFLASGMRGAVEAALPFNFSFGSATSVGDNRKFPIGEYPRPIRKQQPQQRQSLLSNRRLRVQSAHANLSAQLIAPQNGRPDHLIFGQIDYQPWQAVITELHDKAQWVACIDPFIDKRLLVGMGGLDRRKIVGFASGLGAYGELNLAISTEQDTLEQLEQRVEGHLSSLLLFGSQRYQEMARTVVAEAEEVIGLSSLRAVVGDGEKVREVVGFAAIHRLLPPPVGAVMVQLLPVDALQAWFSGAIGSHRPDLLQVALRLRPNQIPLIEMRVIECKFAQFSPHHLAHAVDQIRDGLIHLSGRFLPNRADIGVPAFDRRYWWAQLQRALTSRAVVDLALTEQRELEQALELIIEGGYAITWRAAIFTFWTNEAIAEPQQTRLEVPLEGLVKPLQQPVGFAIEQIALGYTELEQLFEGAVPELTLDGVPLQIAATVAEDSDEVEEWLEPTPLELIPPEPIQSKPKPKPKPVKPKSVESKIVMPEPIQPESIPPKPTEPLPAKVEVTVTVPAQLLIGTKSNGEPVYWNYGHEGLENRHLLIFGSSGFGKTYGIQCLLAEMAQQQLRSLIVDYTDSFLPTQVEPLFKEVTQLNSHFVTHHKLPLNPFRRQQVVLDPSIPPMEESPYQVASRIAAIFSSVYTTMGDQQSATLVKVLEEGIEADPQFNLNRLHQQLLEAGSYGESLANKITPFIKTDPFRSGDSLVWADLFGDPNHAVQVLQLKGIARDIQRLVTEFVLWDLYDYATHSGSRHRPLPVVLDEIQNLDHRSDSPIDKMLREGRKFGLSLILATQTVSQFDQEQRDRLFLAGHKLFFKPADTEVDRFAQLLSTITGEPKGEWGERLMKLEKGRCYSIGGVLGSSGKLQNKPLLVSVTSLDQRQRRWQEGK